MNRSRSTKGFTLVEIMIVVVIIGLLAAMAIPAFQRVRQNSRNASVENLVRQIAGAADQYMLEYGTTSVSYNQLTGNTNYLKGDPIGAISADVGLSAPSGNFVIAQGSTQNFTYTGGSVTTTW